MYLLLDTLPSSAHREELKRPILLACGTRGAGDDAAGLEAVEGLPFAARELASPLEMIDLLSVAAPLVVVDAVVAGGTPGTIHRVAFGGGTVIPRHAESLSTHGWDVPAALALAERLGRGARHAVLLGIEIAEARRGEPLSEPVRAAVAVVRDELRAIASE